MVSMAHLLAAEHITGIAGGGLFGTSLRDTQADDAYLLAVVYWDNAAAFRFEYFTLGLDGCLPFPQLA